MGNAPYADATIIDGTLHTHGEFLKIAFWHWTFYLVLYGSLRDDWLNAAAIMAIIRLWTDSNQTINTRNTKAPLFTLILIKKI